MAKIKRILLHYNFHLFFRRIAKDLAFCRSFCKIFTLHNSRKSKKKLTIIRTSTAPHNSMQISCTSKCLFCGFVIFWRTNWLSLKFPSMKTPNSFETFLSASSITSTLLHILLQNSIVVKMKHRQSFTWRQRSSPVTWLSKLE